MQPGNRKPDLKAAAESVASGVFDDASDKQKKLKTYCEAVKNEGLTDTRCKEGSTTGRRVKKLLTKDKAAIRDENREAYDGKLTCEECRRDDLIDPVKRVGGGITPENEGHVDHIVPKSKGGDDTSENLRVLCPVCNNEKRDKMETL